MGKREIYLARLDLAARRQAEHQSDHAKLEKLVPEKDFPYRGSASRCFFELLDLPEFRHPSRGRAVQPKAEFLFQVCEVERFLKEIDLPTGMLLPDADPTAAPENFWIFLEGEGFRPSEQWVHLSEITGGTYGRRESPDDDPRRRLLYWWSDVPLVKDGLIRSMRRLGLCQDWFSGRCVLLRCRMAPEVVSEVHVPSVLDGFASEVFLPADYNTLETPAGHAIDLAAKPLQPGGKEFVLGPVDVRYIEFMSVEITKEENDALAADSEEPAFQLQLEDFYRSLL
jgi:hypothetical protein